MFRIQVDSTGLQTELGRARASGVPAATTQLAQEVAQWTLGQTIELQPVDTGRSKAAWEAARAGLSASATGGSGNGTSGGSDRAEVRYANNVPYVIYVEYGTSRMAPRAMARQPLAAAGPVIHGLLKSYLQRMVQG